MILSTGSPTARKRHQCDWCLEDVVTGEIYETWTGIWDKEFRTMKMHVICLKASRRDHSEHGWLDDEDELCSEQHARGVSCTDLPLGR